MSPADKALVSKVFADVLLAEQAVAAIAAFFGVDETVVLKVVAGTLPPLVDGGPDEAAAYEAAKASHDTDPAMPAVKP